MKILELINEKEVFPDVKTPSPKEIAEKHGVKLSVIRDELKLGIEVEYEHTGDRSASREIALDHLAEHPRYYTKLKRVESH